ncbi:MAG: DUF4040 domain-containing protein [Spirulina sp. SIO3F2]|nr:DUF4040 domain-containing protein [Spirulina sp. SIO3F2]
MTDEIYVFAIMLLLPLSAGMLVAQTNPYHALIIRGILGAIAALVYALFGAADVALTEALVGTMLSITLYAVAVRSSMSLRLGVLEPEAMPLSAELTQALRQALQPAHLRLELLPYGDPTALQQALGEKEIHALCLPIPVSDRTDKRNYRLQTRTPRLQQLLNTESLQAIAHLDETLQHSESQP